MHKVDCLGPSHLLVCVCEEGVGSIFTLIMCVEGLARVGGNPSIIMAARRAKYFLREHTCS